jgi:hypothetical protein
MPQPDNTSDKGEAKQKQKIRFIFKSMALNKKTIR